MLYRPWWFKLHALTQLDVVVAITKMEQSSRVNCVIAESFHFRVLESILEGPEL